jgi:ubiquinone/menaquinone biosynthesis C-methylase UbiE
MTTLDLGSIKERQRVTWASGDFHAVAVTITLVGELLCEATDVGADERVLDVACGSGNTALAAARRFAIVTGVDYVPALITRARDRFAIEGLQGTFAEGDAEHLPFADESFDVVLTTFGSMFAPDHERAAMELVRVCRTGGRIGMANWTPDGTIGELFRITSRHLPPPAGLRPPTEWGSEERVRELFGEAVSDLRTTKREFVFRYRSPEHWLEYWRAYYGPTLKAFEALGDDSEAYARDLLNMWQRRNRATNETLAVPSEYLEVVATKA